MDEVRLIDGDALEQEMQEFHAAEVADKRRRNDACTIHKNDFDEEFWHGNPQRRRRTNTN